MYKINEQWDALLCGEFESEYFINLEDKINQRYELGEVYPPKDKIYRAFSLINPKDVKVVIVGQDPYINKGEADGLAFSANIAKLPPSLRNIYKELETDLGVKRLGGDLTDLAKKGVFLINRVLSVEAKKSKSHAGLGWEKFTKNVIASISENFDNLVFILWGNDAKKLKKVIDGSRHHIIEGVHPSPLSSYRGFFGSKPFSRANEYLESSGKQVIDWSCDE